MAANAKLKNIENHGIGILSHIKAMFLCSVRRSTIFKQRAKNTKHNEAASSCQNLFLKKPSLSFSKNHYFLHGFFLYFALNFPKFRQSLFPLI